MIGMVAFTALMWLVITIAKDPMSPQTQLFIKAGIGATVAGLPIIGLLVSYEIKEGLICPFCTTAHIGNIIALVGFILLAKLHDSNDWASEMKKQISKHSRK